MLSLEAEIRSKQLGLDVDKESLIQYPLYGSDNYHGRSRLIKSSRKCICMTVYQSLCMFTKQCCSVKQNNIIVSENGVVL